MFDKGLNILFGTHQWNIIFKTKNSKDWIKLIQPDYLSRADPFLVKFKSKYYVFFEEFYIGKGLGHICSGVLDIKNKKLIQKKIILKKKYHLSFPFVFKYKNKFYLIPETSSQKKVDLYEFISFPNKLKFVRTLLKGFKAADSVLFKKGNNFFLLTNLERKKNDLNSEDLSIFQSSSLFKGEFIQRHNNPVVSDKKLARNAGSLINSKNRLYRVSQDCEKRYGHKVNIMSIKSLTKFTYEENLVRKIEPPKGYIAFHTYNICEDIIIGDAKIIKKDLITLIKNLKKIILIILRKFL